MRRGVLMALAAAWLGGSAQVAVGQNFRLNLVTLEPSACGAARSVPEACFERGSDLCMDAGGKPLELVVQFDPNTREISMLWFQCATTAEVTE